jgi:tetratricopeptide (TPR) repeat protein
LGTVIGLMLLAGCASAPNAPKPRAAVDPLETPVTTELGTDLPAEKVAQAHAHYAAGVVHEMNDETEAALHEYYLAAEADPDDEGLMLEVTRRFLQAKQPDKALELLNRAAARPGASGAIFARLGMVYGQLGKSEQAAVADRAAIKRAPDSLAGYQNLFLTLLQEKQPAEALKILDEASRQSAANAEFLIGLSELYGNFALQYPSQKDKTNPKALAALNRAEKMQPSNPVLRMRLADGFNSAGAPEQAARIYLDLLKQLPDLPIVRERVHAKLANIYLRGSDNKHAIEQLEAFVHDDPANPQAYFYLGRLCYEEKKYPAAIDYLNKAILLKPEFEEAYYSLALAQLAGNATSDALATLDRARNRFPPSFELELWSGLAYSRQKAYAEAVRHYASAESIAKAADPTRLTHEFYFEIGAAYERSGDIPQAERCFEKCLQLSPNDAAAQNYLGYMWAEHGTKLERAHELIQKAVKTEPNNPAYLDSLGWVLFKLHQPQEALKNVTKAIELSPEQDATLLDHLGDIYNALGQSDKAREAWTKSLSLEANDDIKKKLEAAEHKP